jgi:hypothetical protein
MNTIIQFRNSRRYGGKIITGLTTLVLLLAGASNALAALQGDDNLQSPQEVFEINGSISPMSIPTACLTKPDLIVASLPDPIWDSQNHRTIINAVIRNQGGVATPANVQILVQLRADRLYGLYTPPLAAGASRTVRFTLSYWIYDPDAAYRVTIDPGSFVYPAGSISECNESNNSAEFFEIG